jgi:hypothetical protein
VSGEAARATSVTATFKHEPDGELLTVTVGNDEIGCTANHPFWSEDRQEFVEAGQLREGERVRTRLEQVAAVVAIKPRPPTGLGLQPRSARRARLRDWPEWRAGA